MNVSAPPPHKAAASTSPGKAGLHTKDLFLNAQVSLAALSAAFEILHDQTLESIRTSSGKDQDMDNLQREIKEQQERHVEGLDDVQRIIDGLLKGKGMEDMRKQIEGEVTAELDELVASRVAECLKAHIPEEFQQEVEESKRELERARLALYNSESRRCNANLRSNKPNEALETLLAPNGKAPANFPKDLNALFSLDAETCKQLVEEYEFPNIGKSDSRDKNLNRLMQFCGVKYQLVRPNLGGAA